MMYTYECSSCGRYDVSHPMNAMKQTRCQRCGKEGLELCFHPPLIQFKGGGWASEGYSFKGSSSGGGGGKQG